MYLVAVCDDEQAHAQAIAQTIRHEFASRGYPVSTDVYANSTALMKRLEQGTCYDVLFLDIDMPMLNGIELCRRIREIKGNTLVVFISNCEEMVFQVFEVAPFRFIRKRRFSTEIGNVIRDLVVELDRRSSHFLRLQDERDDSLYSVNVRDLMYVEAQRKKKQPAFDRTNGGYNDPVWHNRASAAAVLIFPDPSELYCESQLHLPHQQ